MSKTENLRILVSNDDGISSPGIAVLEEVARQLSDDVWVVAPEREMSAASHSLTVHLPVRSKQLGPKRFAVGGTPTDCVLVGVKAAAKDKKPDLVLSGINLGSNVGDDVGYSGTVAAAMEGATLGIPAIAFSQVLEDKEAADINWEVARQYAPRVIRRLLAETWPADTLFSVNFPNCPVDAVTGVSLCAQGKREATISLDGRLDPRGRPYYWIGGARHDKPSKAGVDIDMLNQRYVTVTPLRLDMTEYAMLERLQKAGELLNDF